MVRPWRALLLSTVLLSPLACSGDTFAPVETQGGGAAGEGGGGQVAGNGAGGSGAGAAGGSENAAGAGGETEVGGSGGAGTGGAEAGGTVSGGSAGSGMGGAAGAGGKVGTGGGGTAGSGGVAGGTVGTGGAGGVVMEGGAGGVVTAGGAGGTPSTLLCLNECAPYRVCADGGSCSEGCANGGACICSPCPNGFLDGELGGFCRMPEGTKATSAYGTSTQKTSEANAVDGDLDSVWRAKWLVGSKVNQVTLLVSFPLKTRIAQVAVLGEIVPGAISDVVTGSYTITLLPKRTDDPATAPAPFDGQAGERHVVRLTPQTAALRQTIVIDVKEDVPPPKAAVVEVGFRTCLPTPIP